MQSGPRGPYIYMCVIQTGQATVQDFHNFPLSPSYCAISHVPPLSLSDNNYHVLNTILSYVLMRPDVVQGLVHSRLGIHFWM